jgi:hypothetical protein
VSVGKHNVVFCVPFGIRLVHTTMLLYGGVFQPPLSRNSGQPTQTRPRESRRYGRLAEDGCFVVCIASSLVMFLHSAIVVGKRMFEYDDPFFPCHSCSSRPDETKSPLGDNTCFGVACRNCIRDVLRSDPIYSNRITIPTIGLGHSNKVIQ